MLGAVPGARFPTFEIESPGSRGPPHLRRLGALAANPKSILWFWRTPIKHPVVHRLRDVWRSDGLSAS